MLQTRLPKGKSIVDQEITNTKRELATLEGATWVEWERVTGELAAEFRWQEAQEKLDTELAEDHDKRLEREVLEQKDKFKNQHLTWQLVLHDHEGWAGQLLKQQKNNAAAQQWKHRQEARDLVDKQRFKFQPLIQNLTARIDRAEKPPYTLQPTDCGDGDPGPSN